MVMHVCPYRSQILNRDEFHVDPTSYGSSTYEQHMDLLLSQISFLVHPPVCVVASKNFDTGLSSEPRG